MRTGNKRWTYRAAGPACPVPSIEIPEGAQESKDWLLEFTIPTPGGNIKVGTWGRDFRCTGPLEALEAGGLVRADWLPGIPGNNKVSQTVLFDEDGPKVILGNWSGCKKQPVPFIVIKKRARNRYEVEVPCTVEQAELLEPLRDAQYEKQRQANLEEQWQAHLQAPLELPTPEEFRRHLLVNRDVLDMVWNSLRIERGGAVISLSRESIAFIEGRLAAIWAKIRDGEIVQEAPLRPVRTEGNVIYLADRRRT